MPIVTLPNNINIHYQLVGNPTKPIIVLCHGLSATLEMWRSQINYFLEDYSILVWDNRGHGSSSAPEETSNYSIELFSEDLLNLLLYLDIRSPIILIGMSFGGHTALDFTVRYPEMVKVLILSDSVPNVHPREKTSTHQFSVDPGIEACYQAMVSRPDLTPMLQDIHQPTLIIAGSEDTMVLPHLPLLTSNLEQPELNILQGCFHGTSGQDPQGWNWSVSKFLNQHSLD